MDNQNSAVVTLRDVSVVFRQGLSFFRSKQYNALNNVSLSLIRGETLGIIGGNGSGKSTILKLLSGIYTPDTGKVLRGPEKASLLTLGAGFDSELSGEDNVILSSMLLGHSKRTAKEQLPQITEFSELADSIKDPVKTYSTGMRARLGFSVAITLKTDILLIDEVLGVGDASFQEKAEKAITEKMGKGQTIVFVSHSLPQVDKLCDRVAWLHRGRLMMIGGTSEVIEKYLAHVHMELQQ